MRLSNGLQLVLETCAALVVGLLLSSCTSAEAPTRKAPATVDDAAAVPESLPMGGERSVTGFFITSEGLGRGGDLGGLDSADAHCQALAKAEGSGDRLFRAYLSTSATATEPAVHARDRIGRGPWCNAEGLLIAANIDDLHSDRNRITKQTAVTQRLDQVSGAGDTPNMHDILTGSRPDGTAFDASEDLTCRNWTSSSEGRAQVGHHDRQGMAEGVNSWNSVHASRSCSQPDLEATGGAGLFYCFAID